LKLSIEKHFIDETPIYIKDSYMCLTIDNTIAIRHDCYFKCYPNDLTTILHTSLTKREMEVDDVNVNIDKEYEQINTFEEMTKRTSHDPDSWENLYKSPTFKPQLLKDTDLPKTVDTVVVPEPTSTIVKPSVEMNNKSTNNDNRYTLIDENRYTVPSTKPISFPKRSNRKTTAPTKLNLLVINDNTFFVASTKHLTNINAKDYYIYFYKPIIKPYFLSPELNELTKLPAKIDYRSNYYSLGALILFCSTNIYIFAEQIEEEENGLLEPINYTKPYWFLKRCFNKDCKKRILLFL
jgi:hypothetical protein